jgi:proteasome lid subunit RPN8/RPN11
MSVLIPSDVLESIREAARRAYPEEACGVLIGSADAEFGIRDRKLLVRLSRPLANAWEDAQRRTRYQADPGEIAAIERELSGTGSAIVGFYHSHPDVPAWPSPFDLERAWPFYSYLIVSVRGGVPKELRAWRLTDGGDAFEEEKADALQEITTY